MYPYQDLYNQNPMYPNNDYFGRSRQVEQSMNNLIRVTGIDGAKAYQMPANSTVALFDKNDDYMYVKTTDGAGFPTIRTFTFSEVVDNNSKITGDDYVSKNEFETFKQEVVDYVQQFIQQTTKSNDKKITTNGISEELRKSRSNGSTDVSE